MPIEVCITGGIGAGKSYVAQKLLQLGFDVYNADERAKALMETQLKTDIIELLGNEAFNTEGKLNRSWIAAQVFQNPTLLHHLEQIVHPAVLKDYEQWKQERQNVKWCFKEAAILIEKHTYKSCDVLVVVYAPITLRLQRIFQRDGIAPSDVFQRIERQIYPYESFLYADYILLNDGTPLEPQIEALLQRLEQYYRQHTNRNDGF